MESPSATETKDVPAQEGGGPEEENVNTDPVEIEITVPEWVLACQDELVRNVELGIAEPAEPPRDCGVPPRFLAITTRLDVARLDAANYLVDTKQHAKIRENAQKFLKGEIDTFVPLGPEKVPIVEFMLKRKEELDALRFDSATLAAWISGESLDGKPDGKPSYQLARFARESPWCELATLYEHDALDATLFLQLFIGLPWFDGGVRVPLLLTVLSESPRRVYVPLSTAIFDAIWCIRARFGHDVGAFESQIRLLLDPLMNDLTRFPFETRYFATECALVLERMVAAAHTLYIRLVRYVYALYRFPPKEIYDSENDHKLLAMPRVVDAHEAEKQGLGPSLAHRHHLWRKRFAADHPGVRPPAVLKVLRTDVPSSTLVADVDVFRRVLSKQGSDYLISVSPLTVGDLWCAAYRIEHGGHDLVPTAARMLAPVVKSMPVPQTE